MDYYKILNLDIHCTKEDIRKNYRMLSLKYHPDKNNGNDTEFKKISEAYDTLYDDQKRKKYNLQKLFNIQEFTDEEFNLLNQYYESFITSNEFKLMKLLYQSIPDHIKQDIYNRFKKIKSKQIIPSQKTIDITHLNENFIIHLIVKKNDKKLNKLKIIHIISKNGIYYLYLRDFHKLNINNHDCILTLNFI